jgi:uncharacterized protein YfaP (DUF2135 family)
VSFLFVVTALSLSAAPDPPPPPLKETLTGVTKGTGKTAPTVTLTSPAGGWSVDRMITVAGSVSDPTISPVVVSINGDRYLLRTNNGAFSRAFPASAGKNVVTVFGTNAGGTGSAQRSTFGQVPAVPLKVILTSDTDHVYTDLHIYEPTNTSSSNDLIDVKKMAHVYWANTASPSGGTFFLNSQGDDFDEPGYGPYLYVHRAPPKGFYLIAANYWPGGDSSHTLGTLNITLFEGTPNEVKRRVQVPLATPGSTRVLCWVLVGDGRGQIYVPSADSPPDRKAITWPKNLAEATTGINKFGIVENDSDGSGAGGFE